MEDARTFFISPGHQSVQHDQPTYLYRFGLEPESAERLAEQAADAERQNFTHGVPVFSRTTRRDAVSASRVEVERHFRVHKTGRNPYHYTVELPKPVTDQVAALFNHLFGRSTAR